MLSSAAPHFKARHALPPRSTCPSLVVRCAKAKLRIVYSHDKKIVPVDQLAALLEAQYLGNAAWNGKHKLERAVQNSNAVVAAFVRRQEFSAAQAAYQPGEALAAAKETAAELQLVGFVRASTDAAFAGTIHNLIVHPVARRQGVGRNLLKRLTSQLKMGGVTDVGLLAPKESWEFFRKVYFEEDRDTSIPLILKRSNAEPQIL